MSERKEVRIRPVDTVKKQQLKDQDAGQPACDCGDCECSSSTLRRSEKVADVKEVKRA